MADDVNPYAPPPLIAAPDSSLLDELYAQQGTWRDGRLVVVTHESVLPFYCIKTGEPAAGIEWVKVRWYPAWAVFVFILGPLAFVPLLFIPTRKMELAVPVGAQLMRARARRKWLARAYLLTMSIAVACFITAVLYQSGAWFGVFVATFFAAIAMALLLGRSALRVKRVDARFAWLAGAGENFLAILPPWPGK